MSAPERDDLVAIVAAAIRGGGADIATAETIADAVLDAGWASEDTAAAQVAAARAEAMREAISKITASIRRCDHWTEDDRQSCALHETTGGCVCGRISTTLSTMLRATTNAARRAKP